MNSNDPRLTAYALGEMTEAERAAFEAELAADPAAKAEIESIRAVAAAIAGELREEMSAESALSSRLAAAEDDGRDARATKIRPRRIGRWILTAAASVVVGGLAFSIFMPSLNPARETARSQAVSANVQTSAGDNLAPQWRAESDRLSRGSAQGKIVPGDVAVAAGPPPSVRPGVATLGVEPDPLLARLKASPAAATDAAQVIVSQQQQAQMQMIASRDAIRAMATRDSVLMPTIEARGGEKAAAAYERGKDKFQFDDERARHDNVSAESYSKIYDNNFLDPHTSPLSTFGVDVDTASYSNIRRYLEAGQRPPVDAVRIEELINYFPTSDPPPTDGRPFAVKMEVVACPWATEHRLVRVALKGKVVAKEDRPPSNLVFLIDVSGSMNEPNKLPLVKRSLRKLVGELGENDRVAIVVYAGTSGLVLPSTNASDKATILKAIDNLEAGGSTNGGQGIVLAYATAMEHLAKDAGSNRVILCTDGDFNVGVVDRGQLFNLIAEKAKAGVFLNVLGFGTGNTKDDTMEGLADKGNGQYGYIDSDREADKVFVENLGGTLQTIAKDVKLQLEFNPATVKSYRLIGYENRVMAAQDFNNDLKDSGDMGAGHNVVALYEVDPAGGAGSDPANTEPALKYQPAPKTEESKRILAPGANQTELLTLKLRYKRPDAPLEQGTSELIETTLEDRADASIGAASNDMRFAAAVAGFGMLLRESPYRGACSWDLVRTLAHDGLGDDPGGHRSEFLNLIDAAQKAK